MYLLITILIFIFSVILFLIVLVQNSKGGGLASGFSGSNQVMGVRKTTDFLEKATWTMAGAIAILSIVSVGFRGASDAQVVKQSMIKEEVEKTVNVDPNLTSPKFQSQPATTEAPAAKTDAPAATEAPASQAAKTEAPAAKK